MPPWPTRRATLAPPAATEQELLQEPQQVPATLAYASPEQVSGQAIDARSDLWSLGVVLYEMLTGRVPFDAATPGALQERIVSQEPPPLRSIDAAIPPSLERICLKCLAKKADDRIASAQEFAASLAALQQSPTKSDGKRRLLALVVGLAVVLLAVFLTVAYWPGTPTTGKPPEEDEEVFPATEKKTGGLRSFNLDRTPTTDEGLRQFEEMTDLGELRLTETKVTDDGLVFLRGCSRLHFLDLNHLKITDEGLRQLAGLTELRHLGLSRTKVTDDGLKHLSRLKQLRHLNLDYTQTSDAGLDHLNKLSNLTDLCLTSTQVTDEGLKKLAGLKKLRRLDLHHTLVTDAGLESLGDLPDLQVVGLAGTKVSDEGLKKLKRAKR